MEPSGHGVRFAFEVPAGNPKFPCGSKYECNEHSGFLPGTGYYGLGELLLVRVLFTLGVLFSHANVLRSMQKQ